MKKIKYYIEENDYILSIDKKIIQDTFMHYLAGLFEENFKSIRLVRKFTTKYLGINKNIPLYLNKSTLLFPIYGIKSKHPLMINYYGIFKYDIYKKHTVFIFNNGDKLKVAISKYRITKSMDNSKKVDEYFTFVD